MKRVAARTAARESQITLPEPLTREQLQAGHQPAYEPRTVHTHILPMSEAVQWMLDAAAAGVEPLLQLAFRKDDAAPTAMDGVMGLISVDRSKGFNLLERLLRHTSVITPPDAQGHRVRIELSSREALDEAFTGELLFLVDVLRWVARENLESFTRGLPATSTKPAPAETTPSRSSSPTV